MVSYDRQTVNAPNPLARFSHRSRAKKSVIIADKYLRNGGVLVDFGAGTGLFLTSLGDKRPDVSLYAIEPFMPPSTDPRIHYISDFNSLNLNPDLISAFEVCEHLTVAETDRFISDSQRILSDSGRLIVSVPIMIGVALPFKLLNQSILFRTPSEYKVSELLTGFFGGIIERPADNRHSHKGFDFRWLRERLRKHFIVESEILSPLPLPWWANSQIFFICRKT